MDFQKLKRLLKFIYAISATITPLQTYANIQLNSEDWSFSFDLSNLEIIATSKFNQQCIQLTQGITGLGRVTQVSTTQSKEAAWFYPARKIRVNAKVEPQGVKLTFTTNKEQSLAWPIAGLDKRTRAFILPAGEGLYIPQQDKFWQNEFKKYSHIALLLPFFGVQYHQNYVSYLMPTSERMQYTIKHRQERFCIVSQHTFLKRDNYPSYEVYIQVGGTSPISPALTYRQWLIQHNQFSSLTEKIKSNPNIAKLLGAFHVWVWGTGKEIAFLHQLQALGITRLWLGYDPAPGKNNITVNYISLAKQLGFLIGPYDSFDNAQNPMTADNISSRWSSQLWPNGCIQKETGKILKGYAGRGCYLSSEALKQQELKKHAMSNRIKQFTRQGDNSYFLDVDATDLLFDDFSTAHPMTIYQDKANRIARMRYISQIKQLVLGSETASPWASPVIAYTNGSFACFTEAFWPLLRDKKQFGNWWPPERPTIFFKSYNPSAEFIKASYEPRYRLPLYQAVLHDAIVSTDRWELHSLKIPALFRAKALLESLYNVPAIWALDQKALQQNAQKFKAYYQFFSPIHEASGLLPLTAFTWLTPDRLVQQTQFGDRIKIIANFSDKPYQGIASQCVKSIWIKTGQINTFCP